MQALDSFGVSWPLTNPLNNEVCPKLHAALKSVTLADIHQSYITG